MQPLESWEATVEEFLALQSILQSFQCWLSDTELQLTPEEADRLIQDGPQGRLSCVASVHIAVPEGGLAVKVATEASGSREDSNSSSSTSRAVATVKHLPPIRLQLNIPPGYPEETSPEAQLISEWLTPAQVAVLLQQLDHLWEKQGPGLPIGFEWINWLQNEALEFLGLQDGLLLSGREGLSDLVESRMARPSSSASSLSPAAAEWVPASTKDHQQDSNQENYHEAENNNSTDQSSCTDGANNNSPSKAATHGITAHVVSELLARLIVYNTLREMEIFKEGSHTCGICFEETPGLHHVWASDCGHAFCQDCIQHLCTVHITEGSLENLRCPIPDCRAPFVHQNLMGLLTEELAKRWEDLELSQALEKMPDVTYCPRCSAACVEDSDNCAQCPQCFFAFCGLCCESWHPGMECMSAEMKLKVLQERMAGRKDAASELKKRESDFLSLVHINATSKMCPNCGMAIQKTEGCNNMTCTNCLQHFCYKCNKAVQDYDHFRDGSCILFDNSEVERWQQEWDVQVQRAQAQARVREFRNQFWLDVNPGAQAMPCPQCGQRNAKVMNNNLLRCWACSAHYCYLCRQLLRGTRERGTGAGSHFGKGKCRQHSA